MHEIFTYQRVKGRLFRESYSWEKVFITLEKVISFSDIVLTYAINLYVDKPGSKSIYLFSRNYIYQICSQKDSNEFKITVFKAENISEMSLSIIEDDDVNLSIVLNKKNIILSSKDDTNQYHSYKYAEALVEIAGIYSK